MHVLKLYVVFF